MLQKTNPANLAEFDHQDHPESHSVFGFWTYLMTDCVLFAALFATFASLAQQFAGGPTGKDLFELPGVAIETGLLLLSSITFGFAMLNAYQQKSGKVMQWLVVTFVLGALFLFLELREFSQLIAEGASPQRSAFWSSFFVLVGTHGLHVFIGLIWMAVMMIHVLLKPQLGEHEIRRLACLGLFWHFLDLVWICVFTFVYLGSVV